MRNTFRSLTLALLFLTPAMVLLAVFKLWPIFLAFKTSFYAWGIAGPRGFVGLANYRLLLQDPFFWKAVWNTFLYTFMAVPLSLFTALAVALALNRGLRGLGLYRTVYFLPVITSIVAVSVVWKWLYHPDRGLFNYLLSFLPGSPHLRWLEEPRGILELLTGLDLPGFIEGPSLALFALVLMSVWKSLGYNVVIFLAGLKNIPEVYYDAARVDGAGRWHTFWNVTWPLLSPTTFYVLMMTTIVSFQVFAPVWTMTGPPPGGPLGTTNVVIYYLYQKGVEEYQVGYASAIAFLFFLFMIGITLFQKLYLEKKVYYEV